MNTEKFPTKIDQIECWINFFRGIFRLDLPSIENWIQKLPYYNVDSDFLRVILVPRGLTFYSILKAYQEVGIRIICDYDDLDKQINSSPKERVLLTRGWQDPDMSLSYNTADYLMNTEISMMDLKERLLLGLKIFTEIRIHIDSITVTMCAGSQDENRNVPCVSFLADADDEFVWIGRVSRNDKKPGLAPRIVKR